MYAPGKEDRAERRQPLRVQGSEPRMRQPGLGREREFARSRSALAYDERLPIDLRRSRGRHARDGLYPLTDEPTKTSVTSGARPGPSGQPTRFPRK